MANEKVFYETSANDQWTDRAGSYSVAGLTYIGKYSDGDVFKCAMRFPNITIAQGVTVHSASLHFYTAFKGGGSNNLKFKTWGMDEDNTATFSSDPLGRTKTSAFDSADNAMPSVGQTKQITVTSIVNEILARGGWSSGNALGFILEDNGSDSDVYIGEENSPGQSYLVIQESAEPNFFPSPETVTPSALPAVDDVGMRISLPNTDVLTAPRSGLLYTSREHMFKIVAQGLTSCTGGVEKLIAHGLAYRPQVMAYVRSNGYSFELPRLFDGASDPVGGGVQGWVGSDSTYLRILTFSDADVYYYIFLDELPS